MGHRAIHGSGRWRRRAGLTLVCMGLALALLFAVSAWRWFGYATETWLVDLGDGTLYTQTFAPSRWQRPLTGWCGGANTRYMPDSTERAWTWTWWTWGKRVPDFMPGDAYTVWPMAPLLIIAGELLLWPRRLSMRRIRANRCANCGYSREGLVHDVPCPECGQGSPVGADDRRTNGSA